MGLKLVMCKQNITTCTSSLGQEYKCGSTTCSKYTLFSKARYFIAHFGLG